MNALVYDCSNGTCSFKKQGLVRLHDDFCRIARSLRAGSVWVNCYDGGDITMPFGGYKQSGNGRDRSAHALDKYTELKSTWIEF